MKMGVKKCPSCGKELPLESRFCPYCMEQINEPVAVSVPESKRKLNKEAKIIIAVILILLSILVVAIIIFFSHYNKTESNATIDDNETTESTDSVELSGENNIIIPDISDKTEDEITEKNNSDYKEPTTGKNDFQKEESTTNKKTPEKEEDTKSSTTKETTSSTTTTTNAVTECNHNWIAITKVVHHDEEGHYGMVEKQRPVTMYKCPVCYKKYASLNEYYSHFDSSHRPSYSGDPVGAFRNQYTTVTEYEYYEVEEWIVDREAYEETVVTGYKCSICGKEKSS